MRKSIKENIIEWMQASKKKSFSMEEIAQGLQLQKSHDFKLLVQTIATMEREKLVVLTQKGKIKLPMKQVYIEGTFRGNERGFGFVAIDDELEDVFIPPESVNFAMEGDLVAIDVTKPADYLTERGPEGKVVEIRKRSLTQIVGEFTLFSEEEIEASDLYGVVKPKDKKLRNYQVFVVAEGIRPVDGSIVIVEITHYPETGYDRSLEGLVKQVIGHKDEPGVDILSIVLANGISPKFPEEVLEEADAVPDVIHPVDYPNRRDLRDQLIVTIDGEDAKDLDDAITVRKLTNGNFFLGVHIADVSYYVTPGSALDAEAYERGTSVYLTDRVIPMLPQRLSNGICSLNPHVARLAMSCEMEIDTNGTVVDYEIFQSIIENKARMTYTAVNEILEEEKEETIAAYREYVPMFQEMQVLHEILEKKRERRGAVSFEDHEAKVIVDPEGHPLDIELRKRGVGERLIESFMLAANETVAQHYSKLQLPFIYRIHEHPKEEKMQRFFDFAAAIGIVVKQTNGLVAPKDLQQLIEDVADKPEAMVISTMLLRSMQQAKYSENNDGHYGLAATYYTHFTSPIRRYPDLIVHRLIRAYEENQSEKTQADWEMALPEIAVHSSQRERRAVETEREVDAMKKAEFMLDHIDDEFEGMISSVAKFGFFVELPNTIEGLVTLNSLNQDYFHYIPTHLALVGERTKQTFKIGQKVRVKVVKADPETREIDFELISAEEVTSIQNSQQPSRRKRRQETKGKKQESVNHSQKSDGKHLKGKKKKKTKPFYKQVAKKKGKMSR